MNNDNGLLEIIYLITGILFIILLVQMIKERKQQKALQQKEEIILNQEEEETIYEIARISNGNISEIAIENAKELRKVC